MGSEDEDLDKDEELGLEAQAAHGNKKSKEGSVFSPAPRRKALHKTAVDDNFFSLGALEEFLNSEDQREQRKMNKKRQSKVVLRILSIHYMSSEIKRKVGSANIY